MPKYKASAPKSQLERAGEQKLKNERVLPFIREYLTEAGGHNFERCGSFIEFFANYDLTKLKVFRADFCRNRFCPMCQMRHSAKEAMKASLMVDWIKDVHKKEFIFLTLTVPNVAAIDLDDKIKQMGDAFKLMFKLKQVKAMNHGYIRKLEVTYNKKANTYHPHFHVLVPVDRGYFSGGRYISQAKWLDIWRDVMEDWSITQLDVKRIYGEKGASEVAKYSAKSEDYTHSQEVFRIFYQTLKGKRVLSYGGLFKEASALHKTGGLDIYKTVDEEQYVWRYVVTWANDFYQKYKLTEMSQQEYQELRQEAVDETAVF